MPLSLFRLVPELIYPYHIESYRILSDHPVSDHIFPYRIDYTRQRLQIDRTV